MARIRTVKPTLLRHRELFLAEKKCKFPLRIAYVGLFTCADREGKFKWEPEELKLDCLPYDVVDFGKVLDVLKENGFIVKYEVNGKYYGLIPTFLLHQKIRPDEAKSTIPDCNSIQTRNEPVTNPSELVTDPYRGKEGNKEGKGKEGDAAIADSLLALNPEPEKKEIPPSPAAPPQLIYPFTSQQFCDLWDNWKAYKKDEKNQKYKTIQSEQAALSHLAKISKGIENTAIEIVKQSMGNQWAGLFELKNNGITKSDQQGGSGDYFKRKYGGNTGQGF